MFMLHQHPLGWIDPIDLERLKRIAIEVKRIESIVGVPALGKGVPTHGLDLTIIWMVPAFHDDYMLDVSDRAGGPVVQYTCAFTHNTMPAWRYWSKEGAHFCLSAVGFPPAPIHTGQAPFSAPSVPIRLSFLIFSGLYF
jgi:hypothetical protein